MSSHPLAHRVEAVLQTYLNKLNIAYGRSFPMPRVEYNLAGRVAGLAYYGANRIRINTYLLETHTEHFLATVVPHELAHLVARQLYSTVRNFKPHGREWQSVMRKVGLRPDRCHTYETVPARNTKQYRYICSCRKFNISAIRHKRMQVLGKKYTCKACRKPLVFLNEI